MLLHLAKRFHLFNELESSRAILNILFVDMDIIDHFLLGQVWETGTVRRSYFVDATGIVCQVEELAGLLLVLPIAGLPVKLQPLRFKCFRAHP